VRGLGPRTFPAKRRNQDPGESAAFARRDRAGRPAAGRRGLGPRTFPAKRRNQDPGESAAFARRDRAGRPAAGADASPERSESKEAARPPVVLETVGRRSFGALSP